MIKPAAQHLRYMLNTGVCVSYCQEIEFFKPAMVKDEPSLRSTSLAQSIDLSGWDCQNLNLSPQLFRKTPNSLCFLLGVAHHSVPITQPLDHGRGTPRSSPCHKDGMQCALRLSSNSKRIH
jgi:hypothetical protein